MENDSSPLLSLTPSAVEGELRSAFPLLSVSIPVSPRPSLIVPQFVLTTNIEPTIPVVSTSSEQSVTPSTPIDNYAVQGRHRILSMPVVPKSHLPPTHLHKSWSLSPKNFGCHRRRGSTPLAVMETPKDTLPKRSSISSPKKFFRVEDTGAVYSTCRLQISLAEPGEAQRSLNKGDEILQAKRRNDGMILRAPFSCNVLIYNYHGMTVGMNTLLARFLILSIGGEKPPSSYELEFPIGGLTKSRSFTFQRNPGSPSDESPTIPNVTTSTTSFSYPEPYPQSSPEPAFMTSFLPSSVLQPPTTSRDDSQTPDLPSTIIYLTSRIPSQMPLIPEHSTYPEDGQSPGGTETIHTPFPSQSFPFSGQSSMSSSPYTAASYAQSTIGYDGDENDVEDEQIYSGEDDLAYRPEDAFPSHQIQIASKKSNSKGKSKTLV